MEICQTVGARGSISSNIVNMEGVEEAPVAKKGRGGRGKTIPESKVVDVASWAKYYGKKYQNIVLGEDGSFLVLDPARTKTDFAAALDDPVKVIPHLMGSDYLTVLADRSAGAELRAAAEARRNAIHEDLDARIRAAKVAYSEAEVTLLQASREWKNATNAPSRVLLAQAVAEANKAVADAENMIRTAEAPHRYIKAYRGIPRMLLNPGSGDDRPIKNILYRAVPDVTEAPERVVIVGSPARTATPNSA
jgi:hypothetical protein